MELIFSENMGRRGGKKARWEATSADVSVFYKPGGRAAPSLGTVAAEEPREKCKSLFDLLKPTQKVILKGVWRAGGGRASSRSALFLTADTSTPLRASTPATPPCGCGGEIPQGETSRARDTLQGSGAVPGSGHAGSPGRGSPRPEAPGAAPGDARAGSGAPGAAGEELKQRDRGWQGCSQPQRGKCSTGLLENECGGLYLCVIYKCIYREGVWCIGGVSTLSHLPPVRRSAPTPTEL